MGIVALTEGDSYLLQEELKIAQYLRTYLCSRESEDYIPQSNYWKDGKFLNMKLEENIS